MNMETVVNTKAWVEANNGSYKRGALCPERHHWIRGAEQGAVLGEPSRLDPPVFGWQPPGGSRWSPARRPDGTARDDPLSPRSGSPRGSQMASTTTSPNISPKG